MSNFIKLIIVLLCAQVPLHAIEFDWDDLPGSGSSRSITEEGVTMTVTYDRFGTANGHEFVDDFQIFPNLGSVGSDRLLGLPSSFDNNPGGELVNYTLLTLEFDQLMELPELIFKDLDHHELPTWRDFIAVNAFLGGMEVAAEPIYTLSGNQEEVTSFGDLGVQGINRFNTNPFGSDGSDLIVEFAPGVVFDELQIVFHQGMINLTDDHAVLLSNVRVLAVPEPTLVVCLLSSMVTAARRRK